MPALVAAPAKKRNVVMLITESVRAQSVCLDYSEKCAFTPFSNKAVPDRIPLTQMRALDSTTAISLAIMWSGLLPIENRQKLHSAPILWEYMHAAGLESAYYTSQNLLFGNSGKWLEGAPWTRHVSATMIEPDATYETGSDDASSSLRAQGHRRAEGAVDRGGAPLQHALSVQDRSRGHAVHPAGRGDRPGYENEILTATRTRFTCRTRRWAASIEEMKKRPDAESHRRRVRLRSRRADAREGRGRSHRNALRPEIRIPVLGLRAEGTLTDDEEKSCARSTRRP